MLFTEPMKSNKEFALSYRKGKKCQTGDVCAYFVKNKTPYNRLGITVSKKLGKAVTRNRVKRIIRAAYRLSESSLPLGYNIVVAAKPAVVDKKSTDLLPFFERKLPLAMARAENFPESKKERKNAE